MDDILRKEKDIVFGIPKQVIGMRIKKEFVKCHTLVMRRTYITEAQNKMLSEWTLPKMIVKAKIEERAERARQKEVQKAMEFKQQLQNDLA